MEHWKVEDHLDIDLEDVVEDARISIVAGDVAVTAAEGPAHLEVHRVSGSALDVTLDDGVLRVSHRDPSQSILRWIVDGLSSRNRAEATVVLSLPATAALDIKTVSAPVVTSGMRSRTHLKTVSGDVVLDDIHQEVDVKTVSGDIAARHLHADLRAKTVSGALSVVDGSLPWLDAKAVSGDITLDMQFHAGGVYDATTVSGTVSFRTTDDPSLIVDATSVSGRLVSDFGLSWTSAPGRRKIREQLGDGGARLFVKTVSGDLRLLRRKQEAA